MAEKTAPPSPRRPRRAPRLVPAALPTTLLLALLLALSGCGGGGDAAQGAPADAAGAAGAEAPSAPAENPLAGDSPLEGGGSPLEEGDAPSNAGGSGATPGAGGGRTDQASASGSSGSGGSASAQDVPDVSGGWSGTATDETGEELRLQFNVEQNGAALSATAYVRSDGDDEATAIENLTGSVDDTGAVDLSREFPQGKGSLSFAGTLEDDAISGESLLTPPEDGGGQETDQASFVVSRTSAG